MEHAEQQAAGAESRQGGADTKSGQSPSQRLSRRALLATGATVVTGGFAGCTTIQSAIGLQPSCSGPQREVPKLATGSTADQAPVTVTEYVDFECPHCATYTLETLPKIKQQFIQSEQISYVHRDYPIPVDDWSLPVANAVRSVQAQKGPAAAMQVSSLLFSNGLQASGYSMDVIATQAQQVGASPERTRQAAEQEPYCEKIKNDRERGNEQGVEGTPTIFVNEQKLEAPSTDDLVTAIKKAL